MARKPATPLYVPKDTILNMEAVAELTGLSLTTVRGWANQGRIPATRLSAGRFLVSMEDLMALTEPPPPQPIP